jgi:hypothetical protein
LLLKEMCERASEALLSHSFVRAASRKASSRAAEAVSSSRSDNNNESATGSVVVVGAFAIKTPARLVLLLCVQPKE